METKMNKVMTMFWLQTESDFYAQHVPGVTEKVPNKIITREAIPDMPPVEGHKFLREIAKTRPIMFLHMSKDLFLFFYKRNNRRKKQIAYFDLIRLKRGVDFDQSLIDVMLLAGDVEEFNFEHPVVGMAYQLFIDKRLLSMKAMPTIFPE